MKGFIDKSRFQSMLHDGMTVMIGGFLANGSPERLITAVLETPVKDLTVICNDGGFEDRGAGRLIVAGRVKKLIASHIGTNPTAGRLMQEGKMEIVLVPQGTLAERIRARGAGLGGILTPTGMNTIVAEGKTVLPVNGKDYLLEEPLGADLALIGGAIADRYGNLAYRGTMRNFNPLIAMASSIAVADPVETVAVLDPERIVTPYPLVDYVLKEENGQ
ncbi:MAG TPA: 3-oxoacid CoA-transferase subunit A [Candidatus Izemoplasmatales bacterium]|nr:3-oxoacid CoA-transferase subunit A [Candidatus Izemoplasmatales bacterium]